MDERVQLVLLVLADADIPQGDVGRTVVEGVHDQPDVVSGRFIGPISPGLSHAVGAEIFHPADRGCLFQHFICLDPFDMILRFFVIKQKRPPRALVFRLILQQFIPQGRIYLDFFLFPRLFLVEGEIIPEFPFRVENVPCRQRQDVADAQAGILAEPELKPLFRVLPLQIAIHAFDFALLPDRFHSHVTPSISQDFFLTKYKCIRKTFICILYISIPERHFHTGNP